MTQTVPATAVLGAALTGLTIGYRVLNLDGTTYSAFSTVGVAETLTAGVYRVAGGVAAPDAGGYIVFGTELADLAESTVERVSVDAVGIRTAVGLAAANLDTQLDGLAEAIAAVGAGSGTGLYTDTVLHGAIPLDGVRVQLSTDVAGENRVYEAFTDALGVFTLHPDPGTYYRWLDLAGYTFEQGVLVEVDAL
jgi:hypothetical protein